MVGYPGFGFDKLKQNLIYTDKYLIQAPGVEPTVLSDEPLIYLFVMAGIRKKTILDTISNASITFNQCNRPGRLLGGARVWH